VSGAEENPGEGDSTVNVALCTDVAEDNEASDEEDNNPKGPSAEYKILDDDLVDTAESSHHDNDADHVPFVDAAPEKPSIQPPNRPSGGFADEDDLLLDL
jgi:hypothetical protein